MTSGATAQDKNWKLKEQGDEAHYALEKEREQVAALREKIEQDEDQLAEIRDQIKKDDDQLSAIHDEQAKAATALDRDFEGGFGGQEDLEDRYATTSGEH